MVTVTIVIAIVTNESKCTNTIFLFLDCRKFECQGMNEHAHFQRFEIAMLTLFRISTGDNWNGILKDTINKKMCEAIPEVDCTVLEHVAPIYFAMFVLATQFVLLNVVVAVLMKHLEDAKDDDSISTGPRDSLTSGERDSNDRDFHIAAGGLFLDVPRLHTDEKSSFEDDFDNKQITTAEINVRQNGGSTVPSVAINGKDMNSDSEYSTTSPLPCVKSNERHRSNRLSRSVPTLRPSLRTRHRSSSAAPRIVKDISSSGSLARLSPILGRLYKSNRYDDDSSELVSHVNPVSQFTAMTNEASENDVTPEREKPPLSPRAPLYKMSQDSDLYDSALEGDHSESTGSVSRIPKLSRARPSLHSTQSTSTSSSGEDERFHLPQRLRKKQNAWGGPEGETIDRGESTRQTNDNESKEKAPKSDPLASTDRKKVDEVELTRRRTSSSADVEKRPKKNYREQSYV